jgi:hypothetical protein
VIEYHCSRALKLSPQVGDVMTRLIELQTTPTPALLSRSAEELLRQGRGASRYLLGFNIQQLDAVLLSGMARALEKAGRPAESILMGHWLAEHDVTKRRTDLLDFYYLSSSGQPQELLWAMPPERRLTKFASVDYYRAYWIESKFVFVARGNCPIRLDLTCRIPAADLEEERIRVFLNDELLADVAGKRSWCNYTIRVEPRALRTGLNSVRIRWPPRDRDQREQLCGVAGSLRNEPLRPLFQIFGEIHAFTALGAA